MHRRSLLVAFTVACGLAQRGGLARGQDTGVLSGDEDSTLSFASEEPRRVSHGLAVVEVAAGLAVTSITLQLAGVSWAQISADTMRRNLTSDWILDSDPFAINQLLHPYGGASAFLAARSHGVGFWASSGYAFGASVVWEVLLENETPSINDQITTSVGGAFLGEVLHRWSRSLLWNGGREPSALRRTAASLVDPARSISRGFWSDPWWGRRAPRMTSSLRLGWSRVDVSRDNGEDGSDQRSQAHAALALRHGLPGDPEFEPRRPFDHFDLEASIDATTDEVSGELHMRGLLHGASYGGDGFRGLWGAYSTFDFANPDRTRIGAIGIGVGTTAQLRVGDEGFLVGTAVAAAVPFGAAGGGAIIFDERDYHRGPGGMQLAALELGRRDLGVVRVRGRAFEIKSLEGGHEIVGYADAGAMIGVGKHHAIGVEAGLAYRAGTFPEEMDVVDRTYELRVVYALVPDLAFGAAW